MKTLAGSDDSSCSAIHGLASLARLVSMTIVGVRARWTLQYALSRGSILMTNDEADIYCDPFEEKYRWMLGLQDITTSVKNTEGVDLLVLNAEDYSVKGLLWDALTMPTKVRKPLVELTYRKLTKDAGVPVRMREPLGKILASTPPLTRPVIPRKLIAIIGTLVYPENIASAGKWSGYSRELTKLASLYDWVRESPVPSDSARRTLRREYRSMVDSDAPDWVFEYLKT